MPHDLSGIKSPVCGSMKVSSRMGSRTFDIPFVGAKAILIFEEACLECGESGDFLDRNDPLINAGIYLAEQEFMSQTARWMDERGITAAYLERVLQLPFGSVRHWLGGHFSRSDVALMNLVRAFPWLLSVAEAGFSPEFSRSHLEAAAEASGGTSSLKRKACWRDVGVELPEIGEPIFMKGSSGHPAPRDVFYVAGYYDPAFGAPDPWRHVSGDRLGGNKWKPTHWIYLDELEAKIKEAGA